MKSLGEESHSRVRRNDVESELVALIAFLLEVALLVLVLCPSFDGSAL